MRPLDKSLRSKLENTVNDARDVATAGSLAALQQLGAGLKEADAHLSDAEKDLRRHLRAHGRQLGDLLRTDGTQELTQLAEEVAYEHWHRMLFARFLAENNLLMYPDPTAPVPVSLDECEEMAADEGAKNGWELASRYAGRMLPQIFRPDSPSFGLDLPPEHQRKLEQLLAGLSSEVFQASDSLGWVYQFWQAKRKDEVNASEVKIGARELPAVTQLFTEPYMVQFLLDNALGAWWAARRLSAGDLKTATSEEELRKKAAIPGVPLTYLRFVQDENTKAWAPAAGSFESWPETLAKLTMLDPCCGSGHFLVATLLMLAPMRMELEGLSAKDAVDAVIRENLHGLEIDPRCVEIAAFALALAAWKYPDAGGYRVLPELEIACTGLPISIARDEWKKLGFGRKDLTLALEWMHDTFSDAPVLGSLLNPAKTDAAKIVQWPDLAGSLSMALKQEAGDEQHEAAVVAQGLAKAAMLLANHYNWVVTNVPYLSRGKQCDTLRDYCEKHYKAAKNDLATVFLDRCLEFCPPGGTSSIVLPQNWLFLTSYRHFREKLLKNDTWHLIARLGPGAFETISGEVVKAILITLSRGNSAGETDGLFGESADTRLLRGLDVSAPRTAAEKAAQLLTAEIKSVSQAKQLENPDAAVLFEQLSTKPALGNYAYVGYGSKPGQTSRVTRNFWEISLPSQDYWTLMESSPTGGVEYSGKSEVCLTNAQIQKQGIVEFGIRGKDAWGRKGVIFAKMRNLPASVYCGQFYDDNTYTMVPNRTEDLAAIVAYCFSAHFNNDLRRVNQKLNITRELVEQVPFDLDHWTKVAEEKYPNGLPKPYSDDPTQWIFHGHPVGSDDPLQVAVARLLGYQWPAELDSGMELADEQREWVKKCKELLPYADEDGIVCIPAVRGEPAAADRLLNLLAAAYGDKWNHGTLGQLLASADHAGKPLETWLREKFFAQHCKLFQNRPFVWHVWDGLRDGFAALVNYHKLDAKNLETLIYTYLGDWITRQKDDIRNGVDGAQEKLAAAENLKKRLELIRDGEPPYDIFVRWKSLKDQPIGWNPDLNDGVRLNIRPWMSAEVLRFNKKPQINITWEKDRGKDVESAPWFKVFKGDRINDHHLTRAEKDAAI